MNKVVLDASAIIALINLEAGADIVHKVIGISSVSTVNLAEVYTKLIERGINASEVLSLVRQATNEVIPFSARTSEITGALRPITRHLGLSLGDRACLALGIELRADVYTAEHRWAELDLPCTIRLIR